MFLIALVSLIGATRWPSRLWNATLLAAHLAPLSIIVIANDVFVSTNSRTTAYLVALTIQRTDNNRPADRRDAAKIDKARLATLTRLRRVASACQSPLHSRGSKWTGTRGRRRDRLKDSAQSGALVTARSMERTDHRGS
jgi:hypothetical protein